MCVHVHLACNACQGGKCTCACTYICSMLPMKCKCVCSLFMVTQTTNYKFITSGKPTVGIGRSSTSINRYVVNSLHSVYILYASWAPGSVQYGNTCMHSFEGHFKGHPQQCRSTFSMCHIWQYYRTYCALIL